MNEIEEEVLGWDVRLESSRSGNRMKVVEVETPTRKFKTYAVQGTSYHDGLEDRTSWWVVAPSTVTYVRKSGFYDIVGISHHRDRMTFLNPGPHIISNNLDRWLPYISSKTEEVSFAARKIRKYEPDLIKFLTRDDLGEYLDLYRGGRLRAVKREIIDSGGSYFMRVFLAKGWETEAYMFAFEKHEGGWIPRDLRDMKNIIDFMMALK